MATYYVASDGSGDGSSSSVPMSWTTFKDYMEAAGTYNAAAGDIFYIKAGTYSLSATVTAANDGTAISPIRIVGCDASWNPVFPTRTNGNGDLSSTGVPVLAFQDTYRWAGGGADYYVYSGLRLTGNVTNELFVQGANCAAYKVYTYNASTNANAVAHGCAYATNVLWYDCDGELASSGGNSAFKMSGGQCVCIACKVIVSASVGFELANNCSLIRCQSKIVGTCVKGAATAGAKYIVIDNTLISTGGKAVEFPAVAGTVPHVIIGNHITDCGSFGIDSLQKTTDERCAFFAHNRFRDNVTADIDGFDNWLAATGFGHVTTDTGDYATDYEDYSTGDLRLISTAPGKAAGIPAYLDIGALQRQEPASGGGGPVPIMQAGRTSVVING